MALFAVLLKARGTFLCKSRQFAIPLVFTTVVRSVAAAAWPNHLGTASGPVATAVGGARRRVCAGDPVRAGACPVGGVSGPLCSWVRVGSMAGPRGKRAGGL